MSTVISNDQTVMRQAEEIERLREQLRQERERRILTALWGSRDEECPRPFSIYRPDDVAADQELNPGILGYGCTFADGFTVVQQRDTNGESTRMAYTSLEVFEDQGRPPGSYVVWLAEDLVDFTAAVTDAVEADVRRRSRTESVRITVAETLSDAVGDLDDIVTWDDCRAAADRVITKLFGVDGS
ncbi:hypothetical protein [Lentzea kentuckyensis]|uniref:hypothetical protein n=1 Tax=Lentzea kentuckyensis TaxID=360086 RepID=UPI000A3C1E82|nr:hypothetical protein [Lentzea kentuckyensis]